MIDLAIVGAGTMGRNHGRVAMGLRDARVAVIVDPSEAAGKALATACGAEHTPSIDDMAEVDAAVVCVPTDHHAAIGTALMGRGTHVLVEKPISRTLEDARRLVAAADEHRVVLRGVLGAGALRGRVGQTVGFLVHWMRPHLESFRGG